MSSYVNFSVKSREALKQNVCLGLGWPLVRVELHDLQLEYCVDKSTEEFSKWVIQETEYIPINLSGYVSNVGITLPDRVQGIFSLSEQSNAMGSVNTLFSLGNGLLNAGMWPRSTDLVGNNAGMIQIELARQYVELLQRECGGAFQFEFNYVNKNLVLIPDPIAEKIEGWVVVGANTLRGDDQIFGESWVRRYALACAKEILGRVRSKIKISNLMGGGVVDTDVLAEGLAEQEKLLAELKAEYPPGVSFFIG